MKHKGTLSTQKQTITKSTGKTLFASGIKLSVLTFFSRILGLVREMTKASFLGTSDLADAFTVAFLIPNLFRRLFAENSISVAFIPTFKSYLEETAEHPEKKDDTQRFISATLTLVTFLTATVVILGIIFAPFIILIFTKHRDATTLDEMAILTRIMFPYLFVISIAAFFQGILNGLKIFSPSGFTPILFNAIVIIATYILSPYTANPARAMAIGVISGGTIQALFQLPFVLKEGWKISFTGLKQAFSNPGTRRVFRLIGPTIIGMAAYQLNDVISTAVAGNIGTGIQSSLQYSLRLQELILGIFAVTIGTVILPDLSGLAKKKEWEKFNKMLTQALKIIALITIPVTFFSLATSENLITIIYKTKSFTEQSVSLTKTAFTFHISGLFFIALNRIIAPAFYAQSDTKSPTFAGIIGFAVNIVLAFVLARPLKGGGIALALSLASLVNTVVLFIFLTRNKNINVGSVVKPVVLYSLKMVVLSFISILPVVFFKKQIFSICQGCHRFIEQGIPLIISGIIFASLGIFFLLITKDSLAYSAVQKICRKGNSKKACVQNKIEAEEIKNDNKQ